MNILFLSHTFIGGSFVVGSHHLYREYTLKGHNVKHISKPITPFHIFKIHDANVMLRYKKSITNSDDYVPFSILPDGIISFDLNGIGIRNKIKNYLHNNFKNKIDLVLVDDPSFQWVIDFVNADSIVYRPTDVYSYIRNKKRTSYQEKKLLERCDAVIATSEPVRKFILDNYGYQKKSISIENGVDLSAFKLKEKTSPTTQKKKAVYVGALDTRFDWATLLLMAKSFTEVTFEIIGPYRRIENEFKQLKNIHFHGSVPYNQIPEFLSKCHVALLLMNNNIANEGRSPMKIYEYLASGLPVISRNTQETFQTKLK